MFHAVFIWEQICEIFRILFRNICGTHLGTLVSSFGNIFGGLPGIILVGHLGTLPVPLWEHVWGAFASVFFQSTNEPPWLFQRASGPIGFDLDVEGMFSVYRLVDILHAFHELPHVLANLDEHFP